MRLVSSGGESIFRGPAAAVAVTREAEGAQSLIHVAHTWMDEALSQPQEFSVEWPQLARSLEPRRVMAAGAAGACLLGLALFLGAYVELRWGLLDDFRDFLSTSRTGIAVPIDANTQAALKYPAMTTARRLAPPTRDTYHEANGIAEWRRRMRRHLVTEVFEMGSPARRAYAEILSIDHPEQEIRRELLVFTAGDGARIPAFFFRPEEAEDPLPLVIVVPGHVDRGESGLADTAGLVESYQHAAALALARAGFATFTFELRGFGLLGPPYDTEHRLVAWNAILAGTFYKAIILRDLRDALSWLATRLDVAPGRIGITGVSFGGEVAVTYAGLDESVKVVVFQGFGGSLGWMDAASGTAADQPHYCHIIPGSRDLMRKQDYFYLLAPRPTLGIRGTEEPFPPSFERALRDEWELAGAPRSLELKHHLGGHEYFPDPAIEFFRRHL